MNNLISIDTIQNRLDLKFGKRFIIQKYLGMKSKESLIFCISGNHDFHYSLEKLYKHGHCPSCPKEKFKEISLSELEDLIKHHKGENFEYISGYDGKVHTKLKIKHKKCGNIILNWSINRLQQETCLCPFCESDRKLNIERVKKELDSIDKNYEVLDTEYHGTHSPLLMLHKECGNTYKVSRTNFKNGRRCPLCTKTGKISRGHIKIRDILQKNSYGFKENVRMKEWISTNNGFLELDFLLEEFNIIIEFDGEQHFKPKFGQEKLNVQKANDKLKDKYAKENDYHLLRINYKEKNLSSIEIKIKKFIEEVQRLSKSNI